MGFELRKKGRYKRAEKFAKKWKRSKEKLRQH